MPGARRPHIARLRRALLAASALGLVFAGAARAQTETDLPLRWKDTLAPLPLSEAPRRIAPPAVAVAQPADGLGARGFYLEADTLVRDDRAHTWTARGSVEARYQGRVVRADKIGYDVARGTVTADGHVAIVQPDGTTEFGDHVELDDKMRAGFATGFASHQAHNLTFASDVAIRKSATVEVLDRAVFTPCDLCAPDGSPKEPTWSIAASQVVEDHGRQLVIYRNAVLRIKGVPVLAAPVFWQPDPEAKRASGLLVPRVEASSRLGFSWEQPYLQVLSPSTELIVSPQINTKVNPLLNAEWIERFYSGRIDIRVGGTHDRDFNGNGDKFGSDTFRSYVLASGQFDIGRAWSWGFTAEHTSDPLLFAKYDVPDAYADRGPFPSQTQRLISSLYVTRQDSDSYVSVSAIDFQGLRQLAPGVTENNRAFPLIAPLIEARYDAPEDILGGRLRLVGSGVMLTRDQALAAPSGPSDDSRRGTAEANWMRTFVTAPGLRLDPFLDLRGDIYDVSRLSATDPGDHTDFRGQATAGVNLTWPLIRRFGDGSAIIEPIAQILLSPDLKPNARIPNEDSLVFQYDESNLFDPDKFTGYDVLDGGARMNLGAVADVDFGGGRSASATFGRTFRASPTSIYPASSGLNRNASDWVLAANAVPIGGLSFFSRALLTDGFEVDQAEIGVDFAYQRAHGYLRYDVDNTIPSAKINDLEYGAEVYLTRNWGVTVGGIRDLNAQTWRLSDLGIVYNDNCLKVEVVYHEQNTVQGTLQRSDAVLLRLSLATLTDQRYNDEEFR